MTRVVVIGNAGGGKSTLARRLSAARDLPYHAIDRIQWQPGWVPTPANEYDARHDAIVATGRWIIDGVGDLAAIRRRIEAADTIVLVDLPLRIHFWWAAKRQLRSLIFGRSDGPENCPMWRVTLRLFRMIWWIDRELRPQLLALTTAARQDKAVFHIRSPRELAAFQAQYA